MYDLNDQSAQTDEHLDDLLARSAPHVSTASPQVQQEVRALVRATAVTGGATASKLDRPRRARRRVALGAGVAALTFAGVSGAAASPSAPAWLAWADWTPDAMVADTPGECALLGIRIVPEGATGDDPGVVAAREYLAEDLDLDDVDYSRELVEQRENVIILEDGTQILGEDFRSASELEYWAYTNAISRMVYDEVERQGIDGSHVSIEGRADDCSWAADQ